MKRLRLEETDLINLGFRKTYETTFAKKYELGVTEIMIDHNRFRIGQISEENVFSFSCRMENLSVDLFRQILKWNKEFYP